MVTVCEPLARGTNASNSIGPGGPTRLLVLVLVPDVSGEVPGPRRWVRRAGVSLTVTLEGILLRVPKNRVGPPPSTRVRMLFW